MVFLSYPAMSNDGYCIESPQPLDFVNCEGSSWLQDFSTGYPNSPSLRSGPIGNVGVSSICMDVVGPTSISFWWNKSTDSKNIGEFYFLVDGEIKFPCNSIKWTYASYTLDDKKNHTIEWRFRKFKSYPEYAGYGLIDDLCLSNNQHLKQAELELNRNSNITNLSDDIHKLQKDQNDLITNMKKLGLGQDYIFSNLSQIKIMDNSIKSSLGINETTYVNGYGNDYYSYRTINDAIQHVLPGGTVKVFPGVYLSPISIDRPLDLVGLNKSATKILGDANIIVYINSSNVLIQGFTLKNGKKGIYAESVSNCMIKDNDIIDCKKGIVLGNNSNLTITSNNILNANIGIQLDRTYNSTFDNNVVKKTKQFGVHIYNSKNNFLRNNTISDTESGIILEKESISNTIVRNSFINNTWDICFLSDILAKNNNIPKCCENKSCPMCLPMGSYLCKMNCSNCENMRG